jgi:hypothetical protein
MRTKEEFEQKVIEAAEELVQAEVSASHSMNRSYYERVTQKRKDFHAALRELRERVPE